MANQFGAGTGNDIRRTAAVAADYYALRGLGGVATGVGLAVIAVGPPLLGVILLFGGVAAAELWYRRRFGRVRVRVPVGGNVLVALLLIVAALVGLGVSLRIDETFGAPVLVFPLVAALVAAVLCRLAYPRIGVTRAHWIVVVLLGLCSLLPLLGVPAASGYPADLLAAAGAATAVGVLDHVRLMAAMKPIPHD